MAGLARMFGLALVVGALLGPAAQAQQYPKQGTIKIVVPFGPGGGTDTIARLVAAGMGEALGQNIVIENRGGADTVVGATVPVASEMVTNPPSVRGLPEASTAVMTNVKFTPAVSGSGTALTSR